MARRRRTGPRDRSRRVTADPAWPDTLWPHIQFLIDDGGSISIGRIDPLPCAAVASDGHTLYAALLGRNNESLVHLLNRLDAALDTAFTHNIYTDEING